MAFAPPGPSAPSAGPGQTPLQPQQQSALAAALNRVGPPPNPKTQTMREDPRYAWLSKLHSVQRSLDITIQDVLDNQSPETRVLITSIRHAVNQLINNVDGNNASLSLAAELTETSVPMAAQQIKAQQMQLNQPPQVLGAPSISGGPMPPQGPPVGGPPQGAPPMQPPVPGA